MPMTHPWTRPPPASSGDESMLDRVAGWELLLFVAALPWSIAPMSISVAICAAFHPGRLAAPSHPLAPDSGRLAHAGVVRRPGVVRLVRLRPRGEPSAAHQGFFPLLVPLAADPRSPAPPGTAGAGRPAHVRHAGGALRPRPLPGEGSSWPQPAATRRGRPLHDLRRPAPDLRQRGRGRGVLSSAPRAGGWARCSRPWSGARPWSRPIRAAPGWDSPSRSPPCSASPDHAGSRPSSSRWGSRSSSPRRPTARAR